MFEALDSCLLTKERACKEVASSALAVIVKTAISGSTLTFPAPITEIEFWSQQFSQQEECVRRRASANARM